MNQSKCFYNIIQQRRHNFNDSYIHNFKILTTVLVYTRNEHSDTDLCRIYLPMYNRNYRNYSDFRDSVESS